MAFDFIKKLFTKYSKIEPQIFEELEEKMIEADMGFKITEEILKNLKSKKFNNMEDLKLELKKILFEYLLEGEIIKNEGLNLIIFCGVNGVGKTTSIAKLANYLKNKNFKIKLVAGDTFRAAGIEQLEVWSERLKISLIKSKLGSDPAALLYDAINSAQNEKIDYLIVDTAGRMHTRNDLMREMLKIYNVSLKKLNNKNIENLLVLDATTGQNTFNQSLMFKNYLPITGIFLTKLDSSFKAGILFRICKELSIPIKFIGTGEKVEDMKEFKKNEFIKNLLGET